MRRILLACAALALLSVPAMADPGTGDCTGNPHNCSGGGDTGGGGTGTGTTITNTNTNNNTNTNTNTLSNSNTNSNSNEVTVSPTINNTSSATGGNANATGGNANASAQGGQGGNASSNSGGNTQSVNFRNPHQVGAISVSVAASGICTGQATAVSGGFTMFSVGVSHISIDPECSKREAFRLGITSDDPEIRGIARKVYLNLDAVKEVLGTK